VLAKLAMKGGFSNGMDPQKLSQLDPKLRDVYQRIMGTQVAKPQANSVPPQPKTSPFRAPTFTPPIQQSQPQPQTAPAKPPISAQPAPVFAQMNSQMPTPALTTAVPGIMPPAPQAQVQSMPAEKKGGSMKFTLFSIIFLVFLVVYTLFWVKIFNLKLPFLP
jgi:hypothetical protein